MELTAFDDDLIADLADPEFARTFVARVQDEVNRTAAALEATCRREEREREALQEIGDNPGQYGGASAVARWGLGNDNVTWRRKPDVSLTAPPCLCGHTFSAHQHPSEFSSCPCGCCESDAHEGAAWLYGPQIDLEEQRGP